MGSAERPGREAKRPARRPTRQDLTWDALAAVLAVNVREIHRLRWQPGAPSKPDVEAWRSFMATRGPGGSDPTKAKSDAAIEREQADLRFARARAATAEREDAMSAGLVVTKAQATAAAAAVRDAFIAEGEQLAGAVLSLLPKLTRSDKDAVENAVRQSWQAACARIASGMRA